MENVRKISGYLLLAMVLVTTIIAILGIWDVVDLRNILSKTLASLLVIFSSSAVVLFIFAVILNHRDNERNKVNENNM